MNEIAPPSSSVARSRVSVARYVSVVTRCLMGLLFLFSGLNGFLNFVSPPSTPLPEGARAFAEALTKTGYMMPLIFGTQAIVGALLLLNRFVPLALVLIAPFIVNSVAFHIFLEPSGRPMALVVLALELHLAWTCRRFYRPLLTSRSTPA